MMFFFILIQIIQNCQLNGYESGECVEKSTIINEIPFCGSDLTKYICVPIKRQLWPGHTIQSRDETIRIEFIDQIRDRLVAELENGKTIILLKDETCYRSYQQFLCNWNFPPCSQNDSKTLQLCQSVCTSYYNSCQLDLTPCLQKFQKLGPGLDESC